MNRVLLYIILGCLAICCQFPMKKESFVEISKTAKTDVKINLGSLPDTIVAIQDVTIHYNLTVTGTPAGSIYMRIGTEVHYIGQAFKGAFTISKLSGPTDRAGYLPFEFFVLATTGTGSLADNGQREVVVYSVKKTLYYDHTPAVPMVIESVKVANGSLLVSWQKYPFLNLGTLTLRKTIQRETDQVHADEVIDANATSFVDHYILAGKVTYQLISTNNVGYTKTSNQVNYDLNYSGKILDFSSTNTGKLVVRWRKVPLVKNLFAYKIVDSDGYPIFSTTNPLDTVATLNFPFGTEKAVKLEMLSNGGGSPYDLVNAGRIWLGKKIPTFKSVVYDAVQDRFFYLNPPYLIKDTSGKRDSIAFDYDITRSAPLSADGNAIYLAKGDNIYEFSTANLSLVKTYTLSNVFFGSFISSGNKLIGMGYFRLVVFDKVSSTIVQEYIGDYGPPDLTSDPHYIMSENTSSVWLHTLNQNGLIVSSKSASGRIGASGANGQILYVFNNTSIFNPTIRRTYTFPNFDYVTGSDVQVSILPVNVDKAMKIILSANAFNASVIDMESLRILADFPIQSYSTMLAGGVVFSLTPTVAYALKIR